MKGKGKIHIGTSGWHYKHWVGTFYPEKMKPDQFMEFYLKYFRTVELNNSFYMLPQESTFRQWAKQVPKGFLYSVKASRFITHMKKLLDPVENFGNFIERAKALGDKLGVILFQLPPGWKYDKERFENFISALPKEYRYTFEFRNHTWYNDEVYALLKKHNVSFCIYELEYHQSPIEVTADFVYIRLHGPGLKYQGSYSDAVLKKWAKRIKGWSEEGKDVFVYFDNDQLGYAAHNAERLNSFLKPEAMKKKRNEPLRKPGLINKKPLKK